jgi:hypothetical protein
LPKAERPENKYGKGPNWKFRALRKALNRLGLDEELLRHGIEREVFIAPVAHNWREYLIGKTDRPRWRHFRLNDLSRFWVHRWCLPRARRDESFNYVVRDSMRLSQLLDIEVTDARQHIAAQSRL